MINFNFKINKYLLAYMFLLKGSFPAKNPKLFKKANKFFKKTQKKHLDNPIFHLFDYKNQSWALILPYLISKNELTVGFYETGKINNKFLREIFATIEFKKILKETRNFHISVAKQWKKNQTFVLQYIEKTIGKKLPSLNINIFIIHPELKEGRVIAFNNNNYIFVIDL